ncbi:MAG: translation initiation factor IF-3 [Rickettsiales bacterium]|nr:translation initiation factor IF-3 [Rickettsiales bacterium]|tara:strand:- start:24393 stop:24890 length:498 start_codon:yes stop_codon:yes gene_type:complete
MNNQIKAERIRLINQDGEMLGVVSISQGVEKAKMLGLDLVEISPNADPPVCKILDSGKYKYELQKKKAAAKKNQKVIEVKEIKLRPVTGENDYQVKLKKAHSFLQSGNKVKVTLRFRGREIAHKELGEKILKRFEADLEEVGKAEFPLKADGKLLHIILAPHKPA